VKQHAEDWIAHQRAEKEWAIRRRDKSVAHVDKFQADDVYDKIMAKDLKKLSKLSS
jgi:hypothetical protein